MLWCFPCFGVSLCYGVGPCCVVGPCYSVSLSYGVSPCYGVKRPEGPPARSRGPEGPQTSSSIYILTLHPIFTFNFNFKSRGFVQ